MAEITQSLVTFAAHDENIHHFEEDLSHSFLGHSVSVWRAT